ncbi:hypothetical protein [Pseudomonas sp. GM60]|uniref:hypothetical protein n=1 Tax=Pseudomonas sp. GM60 TaxID=1144334 RepID=UPI0002706DF5|nr:hypothetical protein [Pseudomonas sp. GM60]EJM83129.1 hypothetical protein PMI32_02386 [Pseudomonas sp. GM60]
MPGDNSLPDVLERIYHSQLALEVPKHKGGFPMFKDYSKHLPCDESSMLLQRWMLGWRNCNGSADLLFAINS